jgi:biotin-(acetyl-CoA carboxylase) ligase
VQYIAAIAAVEAVKSYADGYENFPVKIKWPNDICEYFPVAASAVDSQH